MRVGCEWWRVWVRVSNSACSRHEVSMRREVSDR